MKARENSEGRSQAWGLSNQEDVVWLGWSNKKFPLNVWILRGPLGTGSGC